MKKLVLGLGCLVMIQTECQVMKVVDYNDEGRYDDCFAGNEAKKINL